MENIGKAFTGCDNLKEITIPVNVTMIHEKAFAKCKNLEKINILPRPESDTRHFTTQTGCFAYTIPMQKRFLTQGEPPQSRVIFGFNKADEEKYRIDQIKMWDVIAQEEKDFFLEEWKLKITGKNRKGKNRLRNLVFLKSTAKEMSVYFGEGCHLELPELEDYLAHSVKEKKTAETALLLDYKNKTFDKIYLEEQETHKELVEIGLEMPTLAELQAKWKVVKKKNHLIISEYLGNEKSEVLPEGIDTGEPIRYLSCPKKGAYHPLEKLVLPEKLEKFLHMCFSDSPMKEIILPRSLTVIHKHMFNNSVNLEKIELHEGIKSIEKMAFCQCFALQEIHLPESLEYIGENAFKNCVHLKKVILESDTVKIHSTAFENCDSLEFVGTESGENL
ncbi:MAG: leucine-rich repeat protein, partial [Eubacteriales bacterium]